MSSFRRFLPCLSLTWLAVLAGCAATSSEYWHSPSILTTAPPEPVKVTKHDPQGGFSVQVEALGQPTAARAIADIGAFAQRRGFARVSAQPGAGQYVFGKIVLDVTFRSAESQVVALLHGPGLSRKFVEGFFHDFDHEYARQYGDEDPIIENDLVGD